MRKNEVESRDFAAWHKKNLAVVERSLKESLAALAPKQPPAVRELLRAMAHSLLGGGKRVRPLLALAAAELSGGRAAQALPAACALEMLHTYSLIHDDLPAMDDDKIRRGRPACHVVFGEATAILAGGALQALAFETLLAPAAQDETKARRVAKAALILAQAAGPLGMAGGQALDLAFENKSGVKIEAVEDMQLRKTGQLLAASLLCGGALAGAHPATLKKLKRIGLELGLAFQIHDDLLNLQGCAKVLGKAVGTDAQRGKASYPLAGGSERAVLKLRALILAARQRALSYGDRSRSLVGLIDMLSQRQS